MKCALRSDRAAPLVRLCLEFRNSNIYSQFSETISSYTYNHVHSCVYVCMYVCMYACMHVCMYACMYACMHVCMYACMHVCMYVCMYMHRERDRVIINRQTTYTPLCKYMSWYVYLDLSIVWSTRSLMLLGSPRSPVIHGLPNNVVPINHPHHPPTHPLTHSLTHSFTHSARGRTLRLFCVAAVRQCALPRGGRMYALTSLGLRLFCVAGVRQCALPRVGCTPWRPSGSASFAWQARDNVHCQGVGCTPWRPSGSASFAWQA